LKIADEASSSSSSSKSKVASEFNTEGASQFLPGEKKGTSYISRLEFMQKAVETHLQRLAIKFQNKRVVLITFNNEVVVVGDGISDAVTIAGDKLNDCDKLMEIGKGGLAIDKIKPIKDSKPALSKKLEMLQESGATALGPALAVAAGLASIRDRSEIIVCTDGSSNVGVGSLEGEKKDEAFYQQIGKFAKKNKTTISVISIEGSDCSMDNLGGCAEKTSGTVSIVNPLELVREIRSISQNPVICTNVDIKLITQKPFTWLAVADVNDNTNKKKKTQKKKKKEVRKQNNNKNFVLEQDVGNVMIDSEIAFEFNKPSVQEEEEDEGSDDEVPFQAQIRFRKLNGMKVLQVVTEMKKFTEMRDKAEGSIDVAAVAVNAVQQCAKLGLAGAFDEARQNLFCYERMLKRAAKTDTQMEEYSNFVTISDSLDSELAACLRNSKRSQSSSKVNLSDTSAKTFLKMKTANRNLFLSGERKRAVVERRQNCDKALKEMYYNTKF